MLTPDHQKLVSSVRELNKKVDALKKQGIPLEKVAEFKGKIASLLGVLTDYVFESKSFDEVAFVANIECMEEEIRKNYDQDEKPLM